MSPRSTPHSSSSYSKALLRVSRECILVLDEAGAVSSINDSGLAMLEHARSEAIVGRTLTELWPAAERSKITRAIADALNGESVSIEGFCPTAAGSARWWEVAFTAFDDNARDTREILCVARDITGRYFAELAFRQAQSRYSMLFDTIDVAFCLLEVKFDDNGNAVDYLLQEVNPAFESQTGAHGAQGRWITEISPNIEQHWLDVYGNIIKSGVSVRFTQHAAELGSRWFDALAYRVGEPGDYRVAVLFTDISAQRRAEAALALTEGRLTNALTIAELGTYEWGVDSGDLNISDRAREIFGFEPGEKISREDILRRVHPQDQEAAISKALVPGKDSDRITVEYRIVHPNGVIRHVKTVGTLVQEGASTRKIGVIEDVTERTLAEQQLRTLNETLEARVIERTVALERTQESLRQSQKMEAIGQLTGGMAHDFNNLLTGVSGALELVTRRINEGRTQDLLRLVQVAQSASKRAAALTHRLLAFSRRQTLNPQLSDVNRLMLGMEDLIRRTVGPQVQLEFIPAAGLWNTLVDQNQLENSLLNLCLNSRDAMPHGGKLTVETGNCWLDERSAREHDLASGPYVSLSVSDTGSGMSRETQNRAFEPFFTTKPIGEGTGLGLSMIYGFARQSEGQVRIYSEEGKGTMVRIYLPRIQGEFDSGGQEPDKKGLQRGQEGETVLIVDDEPTIRLLAIEVLSELGYRALEAVDGPSAVKIFNSNTRIDLLVTDVGLPGGMNGRQLADAARIARPGLNVLFITGFAENAVLNHGHLSPGMQILTKPFAMDTFASKIQELIHGAPHGPPVPPF